MAESRCCFSASTVRMLVPSCRGVCIMSWGLNMASSPIFCRVYLSSWFTLPPTRKWKWKEMEKKTQMRLYNNLVLLLSLGAWNVASNSTAQCQKIIKKYSTLLFCCCCYFCPPSNYQIGPNYIFFLINWYCLFYLFLITKQHNYM